MVFKLWIGLEKSTCSLKNNKWWK